jgi:Transposase, Mutator family
MSARPRPRASGGRSSAAYEPAGWRGCSWSSPTLTPASRPPSPRCVRLFLAALHRPLPQRHAGPCRPGPAAAGVGRHPRHLHRRLGRRSPPAAGPGRRPAPPHAPKVARLLEDAEADLLAFYGFPTEHWSKLRSTNPLERVNREIGRRTDVVGIFPNDAALLRLAGMLLLEQNDEWLVGRRYLSESSIALVMAASPDQHPDSPDQQEVPQLTAP